MSRIQMSRMLKARKQLNPATTPRHEASAPIVNTPAERGPKVATIRVASAKTNPNRAAMNVAKQGTGARITLKRPTRIAAKRSSRAKTAVDRRVSTTSSQVSRWSMAKKNVVAAAVVGVPVAAALIIHAWANRNPPSAAQTDLSGAGAWWV